MVEFLAFLRIPRERFHAGVAERRRKRRETMHELDEVTGAIIDSAIAIHRSFGPGLLESVYEAALARSLSNRGFAVERQKTISFEHEGMAFDNAFRLDMLVDARVIVEIKSTSSSHQSTPNNSSRTSDTRTCKSASSSTSAEQL
jgi:GxxExxY protein